MGAVIADLLDWAASPFGRRLGLVIWVAAVCGPAVVGAQEPSGATPAFDAAVRPLLQKYCFECHGAETPAAELDLSRYQGEGVVARRPEMWVDVLTQLRSFLMPPPDAAQPNPDEREVLIQWLDRALDQVDAETPPDPGHVPAHRLNRAEYDNTIRDLIGLDLRPSERFPVDDSAHGFDNVAAVLTLSPLLLEKYLDAAERVLDQAIVTNEAPMLFTASFAASDFEGVQANGGALELSLEKEARIEAEIPSADEYVVRVRAWQTGAGEEAATLVLKVDGVDTKVWRVTAGADRPERFEAILPLGAGSRRLSVRHTWHTSQVAKEQKLPDVRLYIESLQVHGPTRVAAHRRIFFVEPGDESSERDAARQILERFATRAFRRPVHDGELDRLLALYDQSREGGSGHLESTRLALAAVLVSPQFLFRIEEDVSQQDDTGAYRLNDWELASRLSYFLWSSMPDEELFRLAAEGRLSDPEIIKQQVRRMLADPKTQALVENFGGQWLGVRRLESFAPDRQLFPSFKPSLRQAMADEALLFFETVLREDRSVYEFLQTDWTYLNEELARHYGVANVAGAWMRRVPLSDPRRGGVLTMGAVLSVTSYPTRSSAVKRGKWILEEILGAPPPPPPPNVPELETPPQGRPAATSLRERLERHRSDPRCFACHVQMDALGLGLENYDAIGRWREADGEHRIDASAVLPDGAAFTGPIELKQVLAERKDEFARALVEKMLSYALGRAVERTDRREIRRIAQAVAADEGRLSTLITEICTSYPFRYRKSEAP